MKINRAEMKTIWTVVTAISVLGILQATDGWLEAVIAPIVGEVSHLLLEWLSFSICFTLLIVGSMMFVSTWSRQRLIIATLFAGVGVFELLQFGIEYWNGQKLSAIEPYYTGAVLLMYGATACVVRIEESTRRQQQVETTELAKHDEFTGLPNRAKFSERVKAEVGIATKNDSIFALLWLDLDRFKTINDSLGHSFGDQLLSAVAKRLTEFINIPDRVFYLGGDEFACLLSDIRDVKEIEQSAQRLVEWFYTPISLGMMDIHLSISVGVVVYPEDGNSPDLLLKNADLAMYSAKEVSNCWMSYSTEMNVKAKEQLLIENELRVALELGQFHLAYQPLIDLEASRPIGAEALIRWNHPQRGIIPPAEFIPLCEENGFILTLGEWVLRTACEQSIKWQRGGYRPLIMSVNLSIRQFRQHDLCERIEKVLKETGLEPKYLELEITESIMADIAFATGMLVKLKKIGVRISIDDFGTGYCSLYYLKRFPIDKLKIDRSFVNDVLNDHHDAAIVSGISSMAHNLNLTITAEGVESEGQVEFLRKQGCQEAQGYFFSRPVLPEQFVSLFEDENTAERQKAKQA